MSYVPLHIHSEYSILNSTLSVDKLVSKAKEFGIKSLGLVDEGNLFGAVEFFTACTKAHIKPLIGCEFKVAFGSRLEKKRSIQNLPAGFSLLLFAKNEIGYKNLCQLSSLGFLEGFYYTPRIDQEILAAHAEGLICITGDPASYFSYCIANEKLEEAKAEIQKLKDLFKEDLYFEVQRFKMSEERLENEGLNKESFLIQGYRDLIEKSVKIEKAVIDFASTFNIEVLATVDTHYLESDDWKAHEILKNIQSGEP